MTGEGDAHPVWAGLRGYFALSGWGGPGARLRRDERIVSQNMRARFVCRLSPPGPLFVGGRWGVLGGWAGRVSDLGLSYIYIYMTIRYWMSGKDQWQRSSGCRVDGSIQDQLKRLQNRLSVAIMA